MPVSPVTMADATFLASPLPCPTATSPWQQVWQQLRNGLRQLVVVALALVLSISLVACEGKAKAAPTISPEDMALITRQAEGFLAARDRLPELATLVNERNWVFTRNLIHGPMQEVSREMLYINKRLLPADRPEAEARATTLKTALAQLDEAARLQDSEALRKSYIKVASGFGLYAQVLPEQVKIDLKQV
jgi:photosystem II protein PsbQ